MALTPKQKIFVDEYLIDLNATRAYKVAYPKVKKDEVAKAAGSRLLTNVNVAEYIQERMKEREKRTEITQDRVLQELEKLVLFDIRKLFDSNGKPVDISILDDDTAACIAGLEVVDYFEGAGDDRGGAGYVKKYKLTDKLRAIELMGRHLGMFKDKMELSGEVRTNNPYASLTTEELKKMIHGG